MIARDRDGDEEREADVRAGIDALSKVFPQIRACGGMAVEAIEGWILALRGDRRSETHSRPKAMLEAEGITDRSQKIAIVEAADVNAILEDARSSREWCESARDLLRAGVGNAA